MNTKIVLGIVLIVLSMTSCRLKVTATPSATINTSKTVEVTKTCVDRVTYLQFASGATVQVDINGTPVACS